MANFETLPESNVAGLMRKSWNQTIVMFDDRRVSPVVYGFFFVGKPWQTTYISPWCWISWAVQLKTITIFPTEIPECPLLMRCIHSKPLKSSKIYLNHPTSIENLSKFGHSWHSNTSPLGPFSADCIVSAVSFCQRCPGGENLGCFS